VLLEGDQRMHLRKCADIVLQLKFLDHKYYIDMVASCECLPVCLLEQGHMGCSECRVDFSYYV
jgi:hypothetical protein